MLVLEIFAFVHSEKRSLQVRMLSFFFFFFHYHLMFLFVFSLKTREKCLTQKCKVLTSKCLTIIRCFTKKNSLEYSVCICMTNLKDVKLADVILQDLSITKKTQKKNTGL